MKLYINVYIRALLALLSKTVLQWWSFVSFVLSKENYFFFSKGKLFYQLKILMLFLRQMENVFISIEMITNTLCKDFLKIRAICFVHYQIDFKHNAYCFSLPVSEIYLKSSMD